jgi:hypothetical protein
MEISTGDLKQRLAEAFKWGVVHAMDGHIPWYAVSHKVKGDEYVASVMRRLVAEQPEARV